MPVNVSPEYAHAEKKFDQAVSEEDRLFFLEEMIKHAPAHKGGEAMRANLKTRYKKFKEKMETKKKVSKGGGKAGIKKESLQLCIVGLPNTGKSKLFNVLTEQKTPVSNIPFTTKEYTLGTTRFEDVQIQTIDMPPFPNEDKSGVNNTDLLLVTINNLADIDLSNKFLLRSVGKKIFILTKVDLLSEIEKRKLEATLKSKYKSLDWIIFSSENPSNVDKEELKKKIFSIFPISRIYTKEPRKEPSKFPMIMKKGSTPKDVAEKILKGMAARVKRARIWGPSSKFPGQTVGLDHVLKDKDVVEFQTN